MKPNPKQMLAILKFKAERGINTCKCCGSKFPAKYGINVCPDCDDRIWEATHEGRVEDDY